MTSNRATTEQLQELHTSLVLIFKAWLEAEPDVFKLKPYHLNVLRQFLKDNGVVKDLPRAVDVKNTLEALGDLTIPFLEPANQV